jgi:hypothetical protein
VIRYDDRMQRPTSHLHHQNGARSIGVPKEIAGGIHS